MKKGFTLIELLAVIVILSVIALIATPMILNVIEESKKQALEASVKGIIESTRYFSMKNDDINSSVYEFKFDENNKGVTPNGESLNYTGSVDAEGKLILDREGNISLCLMNDNYYVYKNYNSGVVVGKRDEDSCNVEYDSLTNKYIAFLESEGSSSNVYSKDEVNNLISNINTSIINNTNEIINVKTSIETLQNSLNDYALKSELETTNTNVENLSSMIIDNDNDITNLQNSVNNINNKFVVVSGTLNGEGFGTVSYPSGFTQNNSIIISVELKFTDYEHYYFPYYVDGTMQATYVQKRTDVINIYVPHSSFYNKPVNVTLMKMS